MRKLCFKKKNLEEMYFESKVKDYLLKYIKELQRHFNISDRKMRLLVFQVHRELKPFWLIKKLLCVKIFIIDFYKSFKRKLKWR